VDSGTLSLGTSVCSEAAEGGSSEGPPGKSGNFTTSVGGSGEGLVVVVVVEGMLGVGRGTTSVVDVGVGGVGALGSAGEGSSALAGGAPTTTTRALRMAMSRRMGPV
jgi:hypothetical protein